MSSTAESVLVSNRPLAPTSLVFARQHTRFKRVTSIVNGSKLWRSKALRLCLSPNKLVFERPPTEVDPSVIRRFIAILTRKISRALGFKRRDSPTKRSYKTDVLSLTSRHVVIAMTPDPREDATDTFPLAIFEDGVLAEAIERVSSEHSGVVVRSGKERSRVVLATEHYLRERFNRSSSQNRCMIAFRSQKERHEWEALIAANVAALRRLAALKVPPAESYRTYDSPVARTELETREGQWPRRIFNTVTQALSKPKDVMDFFYEEPQAIPAIPAIPAQPALPAPPAVPSESGVAESFSLSEDTTAVTVQSDACPSPKVVMDFREDVWESTAQGVRDLIGMEHVSTRSLIEAEFAEICRLVRQRNF